MRMREPLSSPVIGAEDPYLHMERTWDLLQGKGFSDGYPPGFSILLLPFALAGPEAFYGFARFAPPFLGVAQALGVYLFGRRFLHPAAAYTAALLVAVMPENVFRTNLLFPTALDLALLPFVLGWFLDATEGGRRALAKLGGVLAAALFVHPWFVAMLLPAFCVFLLVAAPLPGRRVAAVSAAGGAAFVTVLAILPGGLPGIGLASAAARRAAEILADPASLSPLPAYVDLVSMLTIPALLFGIGSLAAARVRRSRFALLSVVYTLTLLPIVLVDWFDLWFLPHRTVAFLSVGVALLSGVFVDGVLARLSTRPGADLFAVAGAIAIVLALSVPAGATTAPWYRLYDEDDQAAWRDLSSWGTPLVVTGSWEARAGYRAVTSRDATYHPGFFYDADVRERDLSREPGLVVLLDPHADPALPRAFLAEWVEIGAWGDTHAYARR
ncbi:MAG: hypothetical protein ACT4PT_04465 [Methanobacteriota archaeon]